MRHNVRLQKGAALRGGRLAVGDSFNSRVREVSAEGVVTTFAGPNLAGYIHTIAWT